MLLIRPRPTCWQVIGRVCPFQPAKDSHLIVYNIINILIWDGNGKEWEFPYGNNLGMGISEKMGMGMGGNGNR